MITFSQVVSPSSIKAGTHFSALQYSRDAFKGLLDPVLQIDYFSMQGPTFPAHPHAGFSAVTYLFDESPGSFINRDSLGNKIELKPGSTHWTRASAGIVHEETPKEEGVSVKGLQIFMNLPANKQHEPAAAFHVDSSQVDRTSPYEGVTIKTSVSGTHIQGKKALSTPAYISQFYLSENKHYQHAVKENTGGIFIALQGSVKIAGYTLEQDQAIAFASEEVGSIDIEGITAINKIAFVAGQRLNQPIFQQGPLILASAEALEDRMAAFRRNEFGQID